MSYIGITYKFLYKQSLYSEIPAVFVPKAETLLFQLRISARKLITPETGELISHKDILIISVRDKP
jgi:hypothetical protein